MIFVVFPMELCEFSDDSIGTIHKPFDASLFLFKITLPLQAICTYFFINLAPHTSSRIADMENIDFSIAVKMQDILALSVSDRIFRIPTCVALMVLSSRSSAVSTLLICFLFSKRGVHELHN